MPTRRPIPTSWRYGIAFMFDETVVPTNTLEMFEGTRLKPHLLDKGPLPARYHTWFDGHVYPGEEDRSQFGSNMDMRGGNWWGKQPCEGSVEVADDGDSCTVLVPADAQPGDTIHLICRATDEGNGRDEYMVSYARVILTVA